MAKNLEGKVLNLKKAEKNRRATGEAAVLIAWLIVLNFPDLMQQTECRGVDLVIILFTSIYAYLTNSMVTVHGTEQLTCTTFLCNFIL